MQDRFAEAAERLLKEELLTVTQISQKLPQHHGERMAPTTLVRWIIRGKKGVRLDGIRLTGKTWWSSMAAIARFSAALSAQSAVDDDPAPKPTFNQYEKRAREAGEELRRRMAENR